jgi:peptidoglycan LD-endopeptidase CwlK
VPSDNTKTGAELVSRPPQRKLQRPYSPGREGFFDVMQELMFEKLSNNDIQVSATKHTAIVYSVVKEEGFLGIFPTMIRVRAKISAPDVTHANLLTPKNFEDQASIRMLVEFEAKAEDLGGKTPKLGDAIEVEFYNNNNKTKMYGNGIIKKILPSSNIAGQEVQKASSKSNLFKPAKEDCETGGSTVKPPTGAQLLGENKPVTVNERNPRKLNSPTEDSTPAIAQSRKPNPEEISATASTEERTQNQSTVPSRSSGPGPFEASPVNNPPPRGGPKSDPCESKISTVGDYTGRPGQTNSPTPGGLGGSFTAPNVVTTGRVPRTWDRTTDRRIKKLHPDARHAVAQFINSAQEQGYYLRVQETYRTIQRQNELYAKGRTTPKRGSTVTNARGNPKSSKHQYGIAIDVCELKNGRDARTRKRFNQNVSWVSGFDKRYPKSRWYEIGELGKAFGFIWGGHFRGLFDGPHFEVFRISMKELRHKEDQGQVIVDKKLGPNYKFPKF